MSTVAPIYLVRHGETDWSRSGRHTGRTDVPLTEWGRAQARSLRPAMAGLELVAVRASPLQRALETAQLAGASDATTNFATDPDLQEWDYGDYEGLTTPVIREQAPDWTVWTQPCPHGETSAQVGARADAVLDRCRRAGGATLLVAHGHFLRVLAARWLGLEARGGSHFLLEPATLSVLGHERETPVIAQWNNPPA